MEYNFSAIENLKCRDGHDTICSCKLFFIVNIYLADLKAAV